MMKKSLIDMNTLIKTIIDNNLRNRVISVSQLKRLLSGTEQRRYNLVNRAIKNFEIYHPLRLCLKKLL